MRFSQILAKFAVSLFTREWIEINHSLYYNNTDFVSLFTREWIEMLTDSAKPSSGIGLPLYEGVD